MTAAELNAVGARAAADTAWYEAAIDRHTLTGIVFRHDQPLPPLRKHRARQEWETQEEDQR